MKEIRLTLIDYSLPRKIKTYQNLSLIIVFLSVLIAAIINSLGIRVLESFEAALLLVILVFTVVTVVLSIPFLFKIEKYIGIATIDSDHIIITTSACKSLVLDIKNVHLQLCAKEIELDAMHELFNNLPDWGNYIIIEGDKRMSFEFEVNASLLFLPEVLKVKGSKTPLLLFNTKKAVGDFITFLPP
jgi:hypothetical protein